MSAEFDFHVRIVDRSDDGYYVTRWDRATPITVRATSKQDAGAKAAVAMGAAPRNRHWVFMVDRIEAVASA